MINQKLLQAIIDSDDTKIDRLEHATVEIMKSQNLKESARGVRFAEHISKPYENKFNRKEVDHDTSQ